MEYQVTRMTMSENERAITMSETEGLVKLLVDMHGKILGGHILASRADDLLAPILFAMQANLPVETLASTILPYPSMSEAVSATARKL